MPMLSAHSIAATQLSSSSGVSLASFSVRAKTKCAPNAAPINLPGAKPASAESVRMPCAPKLDGAFTGGAGSASPSTKSWAATIVTGKSDSCANNR